MNALDLVVNASLFAKLILAVLLIASFVSWTIIVGKFRQLSVEGKNVDKLGEMMTHVDDVDVNRHIQMMLQGPSRALAGMLKEYRLFVKRGAEPAEAIASASELGQALQNRWVESMEENLPMLATIGSVSPYVGLLGTVGGVMMAMKGLAGDNVGLAVVAPAVSEALIATAAGLIAAIPAAVAYNQLIRKVDAIKARFDLVNVSLINLIKREGVV